MLFPFVSWFHGEVGLHDDELNKAIKSLKLNKRPEYNTDLPEQGGRKSSTPPSPPSPKFSDNVPFFSKSPLNVAFLKILNLK